MIADKNQNYLIPLSLDAKTISALLFSVYKDGEYKYFCYTNDYLYKIVYSDSYSIEIKEKALALFFYMSNFVFGISEFENIPVTIFKSKYDNKDGLYTKSIEIEPVSEIAPDTTWVETLNFVIICIKRRVPENCTCLDKFNCDWCEVCAPKQCFSEWIEPVSGGGSSDPLPPIDPIDPITGGGSSGGPIPPLPPCPGVAWYVRALAGSNNSQGGGPFSTCDPSINPCGPDGVVASGICFDPNYYPGKEEGFPYKWWLDNNWLRDNFSFEIESDNLGLPMGLTWDEIRLIN